MKKNNSQNQQVRPPKAEMEKKVKQGSVEEMTVDTATGKIRLVKPAAIAALLGVTEMHIRFLAKNKRLPHYKFGSKYWFNIEAVIEHGRVKAKEHGDN